MKSRSIIAVVGMVAVAGLMMAATYRPLPEQTQAAIGATHVATLTYADLTQKTPNTPQTISNVVDIAANQGVELVCMKLITAFSTGNTNFTGSCLVTVGDVSGTAVYLSSTELALDGTEVYLKYGGLPTTNNTSGQQVYTAADKIKWIFTPNSDEAIGSNTVGEAEFYFKMIK